MRTPARTTGSLAVQNDGDGVGVRLQRLGDYRILREIGRGGMGVVYEAEQESLGRRVAAQGAVGRSLLDPKQVRRFEREAKAAAGCITPTSCRYSAWAMRTDTIIS